MSSTARATAWLVLALGLPACGGAAPPAASGATPRKETTVHEEHDGDGVPAGDGGGDKAKSANGAEPAIVGLAAASRDLEDSSDAFAAASGDCARLCKALGSMQRAAGRLCALTEGDVTQRSRCDEARARVDAARDKVKASCGGCDE